MGNWVIVRKYITITGSTPLWSCRGHDRMVVGFTTINAIIGYHYYISCEFEPGIRIQHYVIKFVIERKNYNLFMLLPCSHISYGLGFMVFNATFNNISVISWRSA